MTYIIFLVLFSYCALIVWFVYGFKKVPDFIPDRNEENHVSFSIVIPFRNEDSNLPSLLNSLQELKYPRSHFEILFVNDDSIDGSEQVVSEFISKNPELNISLLKNVRRSKSPKKDAITLAISKARFNWIITTDADCNVPLLWLKTYSDFINKNHPKMVVAPVTYEIEETFLDNFQQLDILSLQGATIGGFGIKKPFLCNGANLAYTKAVFNKLGGFSGNNNIASGDDIFFMESVLKTFPNDIKYLKSNNALVVTQPQQNLLKLIHQRTRWAAKTTSYNNNFGKAVGIIVLLTNLLIVAFLILSFLSIFPFKSWIIVFIIKYFIDFLLMRNTATFFKDTSSLVYYLPSSLLYPFFNVYIALRSFLFGYSWKGRLYKK